MATTSAIRFVVPLSLAAVVAACHSPPQDKPVAASPSPAATVVPEAPAPAAPTSVDLRPRLLELGFPPRPQGGRGTCSIFTTCEAIEFAVAVRDGHPTRFSPEFVNWAAGQANGHPSDGNFFHNALAGFDRYGTCAESQMPYQPTFDPARAPSAEAVADAAKVRDESRGGIAIHWIVPWVPDRFGVNDEQFAEIKHVLARGFPVAAGSGHSRLLVGYRDDQGLADGGVFITEDSALNRFDEVPYEFVRKQVADVFWIEALPPAAAQPSIPGRPAKRDDPHSGQGAPAAAERRS